MILGHISRCKIGVSKVDNTQLSQLGRTDAGSCPLPEVPGRRANGEPSLRPKRAQQGGSQASAPAVTQIQQITLFSAREMVSFLSHLPGHRTLTHRPDNRARFLVPTPAAVRAGCRRVGSDNGPLMWGTVIASWGCEYSTPSSYPSTQEDLTTAVEVSRFERY